MEPRWMKGVAEVVRRNRPKNKPQLWEDLPLTVGRRLTFEMRSRLESGWLDRPQVVELSNVGFEDEGDPIRAEVVPREVMNKALFLYGIFEISETRLFQALLRPGMTLVDVGANMGYYTLLGARLVGGQGRVFSFEPNAVVREQLSRNVAMNGFTNVSLRPEAVAGRSGELRFYVSAVPENSGISSVVPGSGLQSEGKVVPAVSLDDFASQLGGRKIDLLKMDIEGAELQAIEGGRNLLGGPEAPALLFESFKVDPILAALGTLGYQIRRLHYRLDTGLELPDADQPFTGLFDAYESPNYFAAKEPGIFDAVMSRTNSKRARLFHLLGRV